jgi:hypothetical protein
VAPFPRTQNPAMQSAAANAGQAGGVMTKGHGNSDDRDRGRRPHARCHQPRHLPHFPSPAAHAPWQSWPRLPDSATLRATHASRTVFVAAPRMAGSHRPSLFCFEIVSWPVSLFPSRGDRQNESSAVLRILVNLWAPYVRRQN